MKKFACLIILLTCSLIVTACQSSPISSQQFDQAIINNSAQIQALAGTSTAIALLSVNESQRAAATAEVHTIAVAVLAAVDQQHPTVADFKTTVATLLGKSNSPYVLIAGTVFDAAASLVDAQLTSTYSQVSTDQKAQASLTLIRAVAQGVVNATSQTYSLPSHPAGGVSAHADARLQYRPSWLSPFCYQVFAV